jgi:hypothetical protein
MNDVPIRTFKDLVVWRKAFELSKTAKTNSISRVMALFPAQGDSTDDGTAYTMME